MFRNRPVLTLLTLLVLLAAAWPLGVYWRRAEALGSLSKETARPEVDEDDPPEVLIGERLFLETRFAQFFFANCAGNINAWLGRGDPVLDRMATSDGSLPGPFAGAAMNCRACHLVDEHASTSRAGSRSYSDFARRTPVPLRDDGQTLTLRNSPAAVNVTLPSRGVLLHLDGEFASAADLARATLVGRNYGWLPSESAEALRHLARVIREDDGTAALAREFGGPYREVLAGTEATVPPRLRLPAEFRIDVAKASDEEIADAVARLIAAYLESLVFHRDAAQRFDGSPYDAFLIRNGLPREPMPGESDSAYTHRLRDRLAHLERPRFVLPSDGKFRLHDQPFQFGPQELRGLEVFLGEPSRAAGRVAGRPGGAGNCVSCHPAPNFSDFGFHNTGATESEYESIHGRGAFARLPVPDMNTRNARFDDWLPATPAHPRARGPYRSAPSKERPGETDLGLWNVLANPDLPKPQAEIRRLLGDRDSERVSDAMLERSIACFKTPVLRDLGHSGPYLHTGRANSIEEVLAHYVEFSTRARSGAMRNPDPALAAIALDARDLPALAAFLRSLNEDYE